MQPVPLKHARSRTLNRTAELVLTPVRQGMESRTDARHHIENLLTGISFAVTASDQTLFAELTRGVHVRLGAGYSIPEPGPEGIWASLGGSTEDTGVIQTVSTIGVYPDGVSTRYVATFQNWTTGSEPACESIGTYNGCLVSGPQVWNWTEHTINRVSSTETRYRNSRPLRDIRLA